MTSPRRPSRRQRPAFDSAEDSRRLSDLPMFATPGEADEARQIERLVPIAVELAERAGASGITISDVRVTAENRGLLTGEEQGKRLSYLGKVMLAAGLKPTPNVRRSTVPKSHGNLHRVFVHPRAA